MLLENQLDIELEGRNVVMCSKISLAIFKMKYFNFTNIDRLCEVEFSATKNTVGVKLKQKGIALLELNF